MNRKRKNKLNLVRRKKPAWAKALQDQAAREQFSGCRCIKCAPSGQQHHNGPCRQPPKNPSVP